ncbi:RNA-binding protein [Pleurocapsa sp. CCALA 161]|uniref:NYN domain-containing protein n=1 Tax=Pleurocapsa sp. CCALA 161 TaxID=2107688 RepID=UPI000D049ADB|nr:NYN domain-containing protein [Pleurocapsa sp. CCALA 161]PSB06256.1 RNA-binding protein [Pleurocapsa sp. CCALA 161]
MSPSSHQAILLVDGYNIIGDWSDLKQSRDRHGLEAARYELVECLINYSAAVAYRTKVVFDAHYQDTPRSSEIHTSALSVHYTAFAETADTYIEKFCATFARKKYQQESTRLIVATSDRAQQLTVVGYGAEWLSAPMLEREVGLAVQKTKSKTKKQTKRKPPGRFLFNTLDPAAQKRLKQMRQGM